MKRFTLPIMLIAAACSGPTGKATNAPEWHSPISPIAAATGDECGAAPHESLTGQDATVLERVLILGQVRVIRPGRPYTEDHRPKRLNFEVDAMGHIARVFCG
ncbi:MAG: hypothetical protein CSA72_02595 [Rhodobacterales bacterium]|nr:MAG: hypothetical protein CSA72_02595 [Rhodobacterales bacterium]